LLVGFIVVALSYPASCQSIALFWHGRTYRSFCLAIVFAILADIEGSGKLEHLTIEE